jgi:hypothetical protein
MRTELVSGFSKNKEALSDLYSISFVRFIFRESTAEGKHT